MLDTLSRHETAEGALLELSPAGAPVRALAWVLDGLIRFAILLVVGILAGMAGETGTGLFLIAWFVTDWLYNVLFEVLRGSTPGKKAMGLAVVNDNGTPVTWSASLLRNLLRVVDGLPIGYAVGLVVSLFHPRAKRLGDLAAGTLVVYVEQAPVGVLTGQPGAVTPIDLPLALDYPAQQSLVGFAERAGSLSQARREELAEILSQLHGREGEQAVQQVLGYARSIEGDA